MAKHKWIERNRLEHVTIRQCSRCGMFKNTRHEAGRLPWIEFVLECERIDSSGTPLCDARLELDAAARTAPQLDDAAPARRPEEAQA